MNYAKQKRDNKLQEEYLNDPNHCPFCGGEHFDVGEIDADTDKAWRDVTCVQCGKTWTEGFSLYCVTFDEDDL